MVIFNFLLDFFINISIVAEKLPTYLQLSDNFSEDSEKRRLFINDVVRDMTVHDSFLSEEEEGNILKEIEPYLKRMRYEFNHWDDVITKVTRSFCNLYWDNIRRLFMVFEKRNG